MGVLEFRLLKEFLQRSGVRFDVSEHAAVFTSEEAARVRGVELKTGVKALVLKSEKGGFVMGLVAADRKIDLKKLARVVGAKRLQLASAEEVLKLTGCEVGSVHPFGNLFNLTTYMDRSVLENDVVNFNAGLHTVSVQMRAEDLVRVIEPVVEDFSEGSK